ncbi:hypothetical protein ACIOD2_04540 [Amycolatopsis sp. NPDC088138]|uniref:hypothetical protein n=1 Tax=Amycolatopsis sp. NPDC088138 TaxID=3363938 RepID=UPI003801879A
MVRAGTGDLEYVANARESAALAHQQAALAAEYAANAAGSAADARASADEAALGGASVSGGAIAACAEEVGAGAAVGAGGGAFFAGIGAVPGGIGGALVGAIACVFTSGPAIYAGVTEMIGGLAMAQQGMEGMADDIKNLSENSGNAVGNAREVKVADIVGGRRTKELTNNGQDFEIVQPGVGKTGVDVFGPNGEYIAVGGPGKALNTTKLGSQMKILKWGADQAGVTAQAYFEAGTPQEAIDIAKKWLGDANVISFPK